jgi:hypothetical protein
VILRSLELSQGKNLGHTFPRKEAIYPFCKCRVFFCVIPLCAQNWENESEVWDERKVCVSDLVADEILGVVTLQVRIDYERDTLDFLFVALNSGGKVFLLGVSETKRN